MQQYYNTFFFFRFYRYKGVARVLCARGKIYFYVRTNKNCRV